jgi:hypothetical protein
MFIICIKRKGKSWYSVALDAVTSGFPVIPIKSREFVPIRNVIARIGKNHVRKNKRNWFREFPPIKSLGQYASTVLAAVEWLVRRR